MQTIVADMLRIERHQRGIDYGYQATVVAAVLSDDRATNRWWFVLKGADNEEHITKGNMLVSSKYQQPDAVTDVMKIPCVGLLVWIPAHHEWLGIVNGSRMSSTELSVTSHNGEYLSMSYRTIAVGGRKSKGLFLSVASSIANYLDIDIEHVNSLHPSKTTLFIR